MTLTMSVVFFGKNNKPIWFIKGKASDWPLNDTKRPISFLNLKAMLEIKSFDWIIYHCTPPTNFSIYFHPGSRSIVKLWNIPDNLSLEIKPWAISISRKMTSIDEISTGLGDKLYVSYNVSAIKHRRSFILSSGAKLTSGSCLKTSMTDLRFVKLFSIVNGRYTSVEEPSSMMILFYHSLMIQIRKILVDLLFV